MDNRTVNAPKNILTNILRSLELIQSDYPVSGIAKMWSLKSGRELMRIRKGKYRAIFEINNNDIEVLAIGIRCEIYKDFFR
jgi:mRNA-degrading endonuclease RelE of RelBE toxin-antitoxin system